MTEQIKTKILEQLNRLAVSFYHKALAYYVYFGANEQGFSLDEKKLLQEEYGRETYSPAVEWAKEFSFVNNDQAFLIDEAINDYLNSNDYTKHSFLMPKDRFENMLWARAKEEARHILQDFRKNKDHDDRPATAKQPV